jgi:predicted ABC-class ATPase
LKTRVSEAQQKLDKALEGLNSSLLSQEHMRGQLDTLGMVAGKIGQSVNSG